LNRTRADGILEIASKSILVSLQTAQNTSAVLDVAVALARRHKAHLAGLHVEPGHAETRVAVREIDHPDDAVDHRVTYGDQPIDAADCQAVNDLLSKIRQLVFSLSDF
jgi:hypothetical protein